MGVRQWVLNIKILGTVQLLEIKDKHGREDGLVGVEEKVIQSDNK